MATLRETIELANRAGQTASTQTGIPFEPLNLPDTATVSDPGTVAATAPAQTTTNDAFMEALQNRLLGQGDVISSSDTALEQSFSRAIGGVNRAQQASAQRIASQYDREIDFQAGEAQSNIGSFLEGRAGFGTQMVALRRLVDTTDKQLNDLEQRKQELILQGESEAASQIANLQVQQLQFRQEAAQRVFDNILKVGQFSQQQRQQNLAERQFGLQVDQFKQSQAQFAVQQSNAAFERIAQLKQMGALSAIGSEERGQLERDAGLPSGAVEAIANVPRDREIRTVGDSLIAIDPVTLQSKVIYSAPRGGSGSGGGVSLGGGASVSFLTSSVMNGLQSLDSLTPTQKSQVISEMERVGFSSETPPAWFKERMKQQLIQKMPSGSATGSKELDQAADATARGNWNSYRQSLVTGPQFLNEEFLRRVVPAQQIEDAGQDPEQYYKNQLNAIEAWRNAGFNDNDIKETMGF